MNINNLLDGKTKKQILEDFQKYLEINTKYHFGYPYNLNFNNDCLKPFLNYSINNLGDPFKPSNYGVHSRYFELKCLEFFSKLWNINDYWGYVTNSGTEGNFQALIMAREKLPNAILYTSKDTHYSVFKAAKFYRMKTEVVDSNFKGEMDLKDLKDRIQKNIELPVILNLNIGSTVKGAVDHVNDAIQVLSDLKIPKDNYFIHCDGALYAMILPFVQKVNKPKIDFSLNIDSISVSGHKFLGAPMPCGIFITRRENIKVLNSPIEYLDSLDNTITGSRNGHASIYIWNVLVDKGLEGFKKDVKQCNENTQYMLNKLKSFNISCFKNSFSTTIVFEKPEEEEFIKKWQLACEGNIAHVVVMPSIKKEKIDLFINELKALPSINKKKYITDYEKWLF